MEHDYIYKATIERIVDGDTLDVLIHVEADVGFKVTLTASFKKRLRLARANTPETFGVKHGSEEHIAGTAAKKFVEEWLAERSTQQLWVRTEKTGKYNRYVAEVWCGGRDSEGAVDPYLSDALVAAGHAVLVDYD